MCLTSLLGERSLRKGAGNQAKSWRIVMLGRIRSASRGSPLKRGSARPKHSLISSHLTPPYYLDGPVKSPRLEEERMMSPERDVFVLF